MTTFSRVARSFSTVVLGAYLGVPAAGAEVVDGAPAIDLLGQHDQTSLTDPVPVFDKGEKNCSPNIYGLSSPRSVLLDTANHRLFAANASSSRAAYRRKEIGHLQAPPEWQVALLLRGQDDRTRDHPDEPQEERQGPVGRSGRTTWGNTNTAGPPWFKVRGTSRSMGLRASMLNASMASSTQSDELTPGDRPERGPGPALGVNIPGGNNASAMVLRSGPPLPRPWFQRFPAPWRNR